MIFLILVSRRSPNLTMDPGRSQNQVDWFAGYTHRQPKYARRTKFLKSEENLIIQIGIVRCIFNKKKSGAILNYLAKEKNKKKEDQKDHRSVIGKNNILLSNLCSPAESSSPSKWRV